MNVNFLSENDPRLAKAIWECWRKLDDKSLDRSIRTIDRLIALERRTPKAAISHLKELVEWLANTDGFTEHPRKENIEQELKELQHDTPTAVKQEVQALRTVTQEPESSGRTTRMDNLFQTSEAILSGAKSGQWHDMDASEVSDFVEQIDFVDGKYKVSSETSIVQSTPLPWYNNVQLVRIVDKGWSNKKLVLYYMQMETSLFRLNGTSPPIHEVNAKSPIKLGDDNVIDYLRFFCFFVRGEEGPFYLAESMNDPLLPQGMDDTTRAVVESTIKPIEYIGKNEMGHHLCDGVVFYSNALFIANFAVQPSGMIEMHDDEPIAADLPVRIEQPLT